VEADVKSGSGSVELTNESNGAVRAKVETGSGRIGISGNIWRDLEVYAGSGSIEIEGVLQGETDVESGSGRVEINSEFGGTHGFDITTGSGAIRINGERFDGNLRENINADDLIKVKTGSGSINVNVD
jgi:DUF4097 and DUF4098 domain-containing protein YvlB